jgi:transcriptional regulator with XRE-family HTH domain
VPNSRLFIQSLRLAVARAIVDGRSAHGWSRRELARRARLSRHVVDRIENATAVPSLLAIARLFETLGIEAELATRAPFLLDGTRQKDAAHARCSAYVHRRLRRHGLLVEREIEIVHGRTHGWIDLLAFESASRTLVVVEIKTQIEDVGHLERTIGWYERQSWVACRRLRWRPTRVVSWLVILDTDAVETRLAANKEAVRLAFPERAAAVHRWLKDPTASPAPARALTLVDPRNRRRSWLLRSRLDGRRSPATYRSYADFASRIQR